MDWVRARAGQTERKKPSVSIVIPAYNEEGTIARIVRESFEVLSEVASEYEVLVGNDGSRDRTREILDHLAREHDHLRVIHQDDNRGVGRTCWTLYQMARTDWVAFFPGDGQVPPCELRKLLDGLQQFDVVVGLRRHRMDSPIRLAAAWLWNRAGQLLFGLKVQDMDSVKLYPTSLIRAITIESATPFLETEILINAVQMGLRVGNVDVTHRPRISGRQSGMRPRVVLGALGDMVRYWWRHRGR